MSFFFMWMSVYGEDFNWRPIIINISLSTHIAPESHEHLTHHYQRNNKTSTCLQQDMKKVFFDSTKN